MSTSVIRDGSGVVARWQRMVSASKDGGLLARVLEQYGVQPVRGSTSRRGRQALLELTTWAERGYDLAITPDGPRGPCYVIQEGVTSLAQLTGLPSSRYLHAGMEGPVEELGPLSGATPVHQMHPLSGRAFGRSAEATDEEREALRDRLKELMMNAAVDE